MCGRYYIETEDTLSVQGATRFSGAGPVHVCVFLLALRPVRLRRQALP